MEKLDCKEIRPWTRFWARVLDMSLTILSFIVILSLFGTSVNSSLLLLFSWISIFSWVLIEAYLLSKWGTTPGKWLLKVNVRNQDGTLLSFKQGLQRGTSIACRLFLLYVPLINLIAIIWNCYDLKKGGPEYDRKYGMIVCHEKIGWLRILMAAFLIAGMYIFLNVLSHMHTSY